MHAGAAVAEILEPGVADRLGPQRLADRVVAPGLVRLHLGEPLPRLPDAAGQQELRHRERAVAHEALTDLVARMQDVDVAELALRPVGAAVPEQLPDLFGRRIHIQGVLMALHGRSP